MLKIGIPIVAACLLNNFFAVAASAQPHGSAATSNSTVSFTDSGGEKWDRWILTESDEGKTLLLVVENPTRHQHDNVVSQRLVFSHRFSNSHPENLAAAITKYSRLEDFNQDKPAPWVEPRTGYQPLWIPTKTQWSQDDENDYSAWYTANVTASLLVGSGIIVDCAKFATAVRWIYAHDHLLPVANSLAATGKLVGQWSGAASWDKLPTDPDWHKDTRFKTALQYILNHIYTHSIFNDLYPTELSQTYVNPGSILLILYSQSTGHTEVVNVVGSDPNFCPGGACISVLYGNEPAAETAYLDLAWVVNGGQSGGGFMRWRWPSLSSDGTWSLTSPTDMPGYSLEQYQYPNLSDDDFESYIFSQLGLLVSDTQNAVAIGNAMIGQIQQRMQLAAMGYFLCSLQNCDPSNPLYDDYSTPSHDARFRQNQAAFLKLLSTTDQGDSDFKDFLSEAKTPLFPENETTTYDYITDVNGISDAMSPDPTQSFASRWALDTTNTLITNASLIVAWNQAIETRFTLVNQAQSLCYPNSTTTSQCNAQSAAVKALGTSRLDLSLQQSRAALKTYFNTQTSSVQKKLVSDSTQSGVDADFCTWNSNGYCSVEDFVFSDQDMIDQMSSDPTATASARWGIN